MALGISQIEVARRIGVTRQSVARWEREEAPTEPEGEYLEALAELYGTSTKALRAGEVASLSRESTAAPVTRAARRLDPRVYAVVYDYLQRLEAVGCGEQQLEEAERIMSDFAFAQLHADPARAKTVEQQLLDVHAAWNAIRESIERHTGRRP